MRIGQTALVIGLLFAQGTNSGITPFQRRCGLGSPNLLTHGFEGQALGTEHNLVVFKPGHFSFQGINTAQPTQRCACLRLRRTGQLLLLKIPLQPQLQFAFMPGIQHHNALRF